MVTETSSKSRSSRNWVSGASDLAFGVARAQRVDGQGDARVAQRWPRPGMPPVGGATVSRNPTETSWKDQTGTSDPAAGLAPPGVRREQRRVGVGRVDPGHPGDHDTVVVPGRVVGVDVQQFEDLVDARAEVHAHEEVWTYDIQQRNVTHGPALQGRDHARTPRRGV